MKKPFWIIAILFASVSAAAAQPKPLEVTVADLAAAGLMDAIAIAPNRDRFKPPVAYFRITEKLSASEAKADCADCADLVAVYTVETSAAPRWSVEPNQQFVKIGGRLQVRAYLAKQKRIVTVTAPSETTARAISAALIAKFSK